MLLLNPLTLKTGYQVLTASHGLFVTGTGTGVGKTIVTAGLARALRDRGIDVGVMKPVETGVSDAGPLAPGSDAAFLARMAGVQDEPDLICPVRLREPAAPMVAAAAEGAEIAPASLVAAFQALARRRQFVLVEGAGGLAVPIRQGYLMVDLARELGLPVLIVGSLALGTINHTLLTDHYVRTHGVVVAGIILNSPEPESGSLAERTNAQVIASLTATPVLGTIGYLPGADSQEGSLRLVRACSELLDREFETAPTLT